MNIAKLFDVDARLLILTLLNIFIRPILNLFISIRIYLAKKFIRHVFRKCLQLDQRHQ